MSEKRLTVLLAEDNDDDLILIRRALDRVEMIDRVVSVQTGEHVIPYLRGDGEHADRLKYPFPDLILLDHHMPRLCGLDLLFWLRTEPRYHRMPVVVLTGGLCEAEIDMAERLNASWVLKTLDPTSAPPAIAQGIRIALDLVQEPA